MKPDSALGIMQPYFFPYIGYFDLINRTDKWIVFDEVKYQKKSWMNRNRILHPTEGWQYINVPVSNAHDEELIKNIKVLDIGAIGKKIEAQITHYKKGRAPYFSAVLDLIRATFARTSADLLRDLNVSSLISVCEYLGIDFDYDIMSECHLTLPEIVHPGQWALEISSALGYKHYVNPPGGREIFLPEEWEERGIRLEFTEIPDLVYSTGQYQFVPGLSIIDVLMWNSPEQIKGWLEAQKAK